MTRRFPTLSTNRLGAPRRLTHPGYGFVGTIQKHDSGWYASAADNTLLGSYRTGREAREALEAKAHDEQAKRLS